MSDFDKFKELKKRLHWNEMLGQDPMKVKWADPPTLEAKRKTKSDFDKFKEMKKRLRKQQVLAAVIQKRTSTIRKQPSQQPITDSLKQSSDDSLFSETILQTKKARRRHDYEKMTVEAKAK